MATDRPTIPRGKYIDRPIEPKIGKPVEVVEADRLMRCPACGGWIVCRDLGQVFEDEGELPHPAEDREQ